MYAVGRPHPLRASARGFFIESIRDNTPLSTSVEVLQELVHAYLPVGRVDTLDAATMLAASSGVVVWPLEEADVLLARQLYGRFSELGARDLCHLASCLRRGVREIKTFDETLRIAASRLGDSNA